MLDPSKLMPNSVFEEPIYKTYSFNEGLTFILKILAFASIFALISVIISFILGVRKKDLIAVFFTNILIKTITVFIFRTFFIASNIKMFFIRIILFILIIFVEGIIYKKVLSYKQNSGIVLSILCNLCAVLLFIYLLFTPIIGPFLWSI